MTPADSMCATHPAVRSTATCTRCGRFACNACLSSDGSLCVDCLARLAQELPPLKDRALFAMGGVALTCAFHALMALFAGLMVGKGELSDESPLMLLNGLAALGYLFVFIISVVLVCRWFHLAIRYALARGATLEVKTPGQGVGSWFIPFVNLVRPFNVTRQMMANAGLDAGLVGAWQGLWVTGNILANAGSRVPGDAGLWLSVGSDLFLIGAGAAFIAVARKLDWSPAEGQGGALQSGARVL